MDPRDVRVLCAGRPSPVLESSHAPNHPARCATLPVDGTPPAHPRHARNHTGTIRPLTQRGFESRCRDRHDERPPRHEPEGQSGVRRCGQSVALVSCVGRVG